ncbi:unnamed protein product [Caenorhabditis sp. 36 PRJEB53466]|nr:unnamed protein product [Caenorhabditis sp. 36 PRJEB53466]
MSKSQIKRLHQQQEAEKANLGEEEEEPVQVQQRKGPANRFAFFDDEDESNDDDAKSEEETGSSQPKTTADKKKAKKSKKKGKKGGAEVVEETENQMLARMAALNAKESKKAAAASADQAPSVEELMKVDMKMFDMSAEIKRKLGKAFKEVTTPGATEENRWPPGRRAVGRIVKNKPKWFPERDYGLSMVQTDETKDGAVWFHLKHNKNYEGRERLFWLAEAQMNPEVVHEIFSDTPYHLNSLLMMAHMNRMNEDFNQGADLIERGIWYVDQYAAPTFEPFNWRHRLDYTDYENRAFFLLLHRHMLNAAHKRCWETAWNTAKLIFKLDPTGDPLAIMSIIDGYALKAKQFQWVLNTYEAAKSFKKLNLLPNWPYSVALARHALAKDEGEHETAEKELRLAIRHFPSVVVQLMDNLQINPDSAVMNCKMFTSFVADNEPDSLKLLVKIYAKETEEVWKQPEILLFLENSTRRVAVSSDKQEIDECSEWRNKRKRMYASRSPNVARLCQLLDVVPSSSLSDPEPPKNGRCGYERDAHGLATGQPVVDNLVGALIHSLMPNYEPDRTLQEQLGRHSEEFMRYMAEHLDGARISFTEITEAITTWLDGRNEQDRLAAANVVPLDGHEAVELPEEEGEGEGEGADENRE